MEGLGAGIASLAFWGFIATAVVGGIWYALRERQAQDETVVNQVLGGSKHLDRDLRIAAYIVLAAAPGIALCGWFVSLLSKPWLFPMLGAAVLVGCVGLGLLLASTVAARARRDDDPGGSSGVRVR